MVRKIYGQTFGNHNQCVLPKGRSFTAIPGTKVAVLSRGRSYTANSGTKAAVLLRINRCGSFQLLSAHHSLFSSLTDLKRTEKFTKISGWPYVHLCLLVIDWLVNNIDHFYLLSFLVTRNGVLVL